MNRAGILAATGALALALGACTTAESTPDSADEATTGDTAADPSPAATDDGTGACFEDGEELEGEARLYIEHNATDGDTGFHGTIDQEGLSETCVVTPDGTRILVVDPVGQLGDLGLNQFFFESREPPYDEYSIADLKADFPEGDYRISGIDHEGTRRVGSALFTHAIPQQPTITAPALVDEEQAESNVIDAAGLSILWEPVTETIDGEPVTISGYEVIVTQAEHEDPHGRTRPEYDVHVPPAMTELAVPEGFLRPQTVYEVEVLALEQSGNQTITVGFFTTG